MAKQQTPAPASEPSRIERMLAYVVVSVIGLSIICFAAYLIGLALGAFGPGKVVPQIWQVIVVLPGVGLPIGFLFLVALLILIAVRRSRSAKGAGK